MGDPNWPEATLEALKLFKEAKVIDIFTHDINDIWKRVRLVLDPQTEPIYEHRLFFNETFSRKIISITENGQNIILSSNLNPKYIVLTYSPHYNWVIELILRENLNLQHSRGVQVPLVQFYNSGDIPSWTLLDNIIRRR